MEILALEVKMDGKASSNIELYTKSVLDTISQLKTKELITDEDFSSADQVVKICKVQESNLFTAKQAAQDQSKSISEVFAAIDNAANIFRETRLVLEKQIKTEKVFRKSKIIEGAFNAFWKAHDEVTARFKVDVKSSSISITKAFTEATKNKKNIDSMQEAVDAALETEIANLENAASKKFSNLQIIRGRHDQILFPDSDALSDFQPDRLMEEITKREAEHAQQAKIQKEKAEKVAEEKLRKEEMEKKRLAAIPDPEPEKPANPTEELGKKFAHEVGSIPNRKFFKLEGEPEQTETQQEDPSPMFKMRKFRIKIKGSWVFEDTIEGAKEKATDLKNKFGDQVSLNSIA